MRHSLLVLLVIFLGLGSRTALASTSDGASAQREWPLVHALGSLGIRYQYGGRSPQSGFDCSGLVTHVFQKAWGLLLPGTARELSQAGIAVAAAEIQPGDLVFYNTRKRPYSHVGIYVGEGRFVHAPRSGQRVRVESVDSPYWRARFNGARRVEPPDSY
jgi:cell wall-associated NlpC family hydrolase